MITMLFQRAYDCRRVLTILTLVLNLVFGIVFSLTTFRVVGQCLTSPCVAETDTLLKINSGLSFAILLTGFLFVLQPVYGLWFFKYKCTDVVGGGFIGATLFLGLQAMTVSTSWASVADGVRDMDPLVFSSVKVEGNEQYVSAFQTLTSISGLYCFLAFFNAIQLSFCLEYFCDNDAAKLRAQRFVQRIRQGYQYHSVYASSPDHVLDDHDLDDEI